MGSGLPLMLSVIEYFFPLKNGSYPLVVLTPVDYLFFEQFDHLILSNLHYLMANLWTNCVFAGIDTIYLCTVQHVAALFAIDWYKILNFYKL